MRLILQSHPPRIIALFQRLSWGDYYIEEYLLTINTRILTLRPQAVDFSTYQAADSRSC